MKCVTHFLEVMKVGGGEKVFVGVDIDGKLPGGEVEGGLGFDCKS
jgi:hypothetical protein